MPLGSTKHVTLLAKETAIFRGLGDAQQEAGTVYCVDAVCPHLGANMGRGGKVVENKIEWSVAQDSVRIRMRSAIRRAADERIRVFGPFAPPSSAMIVSRPKSTDDTFIFSFVTTSESYTSLPAVSLDLRACDSRAHSHLTCRSLRCDLQPVPWLAV